jgi:hypothetical protein
VLGRDARLGRPFSTDEFLSRHHVLVRPIGYSLEVIDLGSANGTYGIGQIALKLTAPEEQGEAPPTGERSALPETHRFSPGDPRRYGGRGA